MSTVAPSRPDSRTAWRWLCDTSTRMNRACGTTPTHATEAKRHLSLTVKPVSRSKDTSGFVILPRRRITERSLAWVMNARRHARDYQRLIQHSETLITWAAITLMNRRLTRRPKTSTAQDQLTQAA